MGNKKYTPIDWGILENPEMSEIEIMRLVPDEIIQYYLSHYKPKGIRLDLKTAVQIQYILYGNMEEQLNGM